MTPETQELLKTCITQAPDLNKHDTDELLLLTDNLSGHIPELVDIYQAVCEEATLDKAPLGFKQTGDTYQFADSPIHFNKQELIAYLAIIIDALDETLPLGSVVDLKKEYLKDNLPVDEIDNVRIVITYRFLHNPKDQFYFPYAGVVYPIGSLGQDRMLHFTSPFIARVVHKGFSDGQDEAFVSAMKQELLCNRRLHSFSFATKDEVEGKREAT